MNPSASASTSSVNPMIQFTSRGRRKAPVKKTRQRWRVTTPTKTSAVQWWIWRINRPALVSKLMRRTESYAADTWAPAIGAYGPS